MTDTSAYQRERSVSGWAVGFAAFAGVMMIMLGMFHFFAGIAAIANDDYFVVGKNYTYDLDTTTWGWIHLIGGVVVFAAGLAVIAGQVWARVIGVGLALLSAVTNFFFIPYYPVWSIVMIAVDIAIIWALMVYGRREAAY